jgi:RsiW-degrading membrane proteinase PrsW (M82 family)
MTTTPTFAARPAEPLGGHAAITALGERIKRAARRRAGRVRVVLLIIFLLLPLLLTSLLEGR